MIALPFFCVIFLGYSCKIGELLGTTTDKCGLKASSFDEMRLKEKMFYLI